MSLDVTLRIKGTKRAIQPQIFVRENGQNVQITRTEWDRRNPGREPVMLMDRIQEDVVYESNITHNLVKMAYEAGLYEYLWRADDAGVKYADELIEPLREALTRMKAHPEQFTKHNPDNGWGSYDSFVSFIERYLAACMKYPHAEVEVSR